MLHLYAALAEKERRLIAARALVNSSPSEFTEASVASTRWSKVVPLRITPVTKNVRCGNSIATHPAISLALHFGPSHYQEHIAEAVEQDDTLSPSVSLLITAAQREQLREFA